MAIGGLGVGLRPCSQEAASVWLAGTRAVVIS